MKTIKSISWILLIIAIVCVYSCNNKENTIAEKLREINKKIQSDSLNIENYFARIMILDKMHYSTGPITPKEQINKDLDKIIKIDSLNILAYVWLARISSSKGEYSKAIGFYTKVLDIGGPTLKDSASIYFQRGYLHERLGFYKEALDDYRNSDSLSPMKVVYRASGRCNLWLLKYSDALLDFKEEFKMSENGYDSLQCLSYILHIFSSTKMGNKALQYLSNYETLFYLDQPKLNYYKGVLLLHLLDTESAMRSFNNVINQKRDTAYHGHSYFYLSIIAAIEKQKNIAKDNLEQACKFGFYDYDLLNAWRQYMSESFFKEMANSLIANQSIGAKNHKLLISEIIKKTNTDDYDKATFLLECNRRIQIILLEPYKQNEYRELLKACY